MIMSTTTTERESLDLVLQGKMASKVAIADTMRGAYRVLDRLSDGRFSHLRFVYGEDFEVVDDLMADFQAAVQEALAYKEALVFGRPVTTRIVGLSSIEDHATRQMAARLHHRT